MMQGKMKSFLEDTGIILVLSGTIYGGYYLYTTLLTETVSSDIVENNKKEISSPYSINDNNNTIIVPAVKNKIENNENNETIIQNKEIVEVSSKIVDNNISLKSAPEIKEVLVQTEKKVEIEKTVKQIKIEEKTIIKKEQKKETKKADADLLKEFIETVRSDITSNIIFDDSFEDKSKIDIKIRITVLKDGTYEQLIFVDGDKKLYDINKKNIVKIFPLTIKENIESAFPRYLRLHLR